LALAAAVAVTVAVSRGRGNVCPVVTRETREYRYAAVGFWRWWWRFRVKSALGGNEIRIDDVAIDMRGVD
jgi:hypothetical protein